MAELFENFEVHKPTRTLRLRVLGVRVTSRVTPQGLRVLRLILVSLLLHVLLVAAALYGPILREAFDVAGKFSGAEFVEEDYQKTKIKDLVVVADLSHFGYPEGYFNIGAETPAAEIVPLPMPTPLPPPRPIRQPRPAPTPTPEPTPTATPTPDPKTPEDAEKALEEVEAKSGVTRPYEDKINKKPLKDWLATWNDKYKEGQVNLDKTIELVIVARRDDKGKLTDPQVETKSGDPILIEAGKDLVAAINDSNMLYFLEGVGGGTVRFFVKLDGEKVTASVESEVESEARASKMAATYGVMLWLSSKARQGKDEAVIYENTQISAKGKQIVVNFSMPRQAAGDMLKKQLPAG